MSDRRAVSEGSEPRSGVTGVAKDIWGNYPKSPFWFHLLESQEKFGQDIGNMRGGRLQRGSRRELVTGP